MNARPERIEVIGGGPAGSSAALAALAEGASVTIHEKSRAPRHKVCGEFLSPEIGPTLEALGLWPAFLAARPARIERAVLHLRGGEKRFRLPEPAWGLSRRALDQLLLDEALRRGVVRTFERRKPEHTASELRDGTALVLAHGRRRGAPPGARLFGFKAHFRSDAPDDTVELCFAADHYVGISPVEDGALNVCGLASEDALRACDFQPEALFPEHLRRRLQGLERCFDWLMTGPIVLGSGARAPAHAYLAGDALGFVDPFTGSGLLAALVTGRAAGIAASRGLAPELHHAECERALQRQRQVAATLRRMLAHGWTETLARWIPGRLLYRLTRPGLDFATR